MWASIRLNDVKPTDRCMRGEPVLAEGPLERPGRRAISSTWTSSRSRGDQAGQPADRRQPGRPAAEVLDAAAGDPPVGHQQQAQPQRGQPAPAASRRRRGPGAGRRARWSGERDPTAVMCRRRRSPPLRPAESGASPGRPGGARGRRRRRVRRSPVAAVVAAEEVVPRRLGAPRGGVTDREATESRDPGDPQAAAARARRCRRTRGRWQGPVPGETVRRRDGCRRRDRWVPSASHWARQGSELRPPRSRPPRVSRRLMTPILCARAERTLCRVCESACQPPDGSPGPDGSPRPDRSARGRESVRPPLPLRGVADIKSPCWGVLGVCHQSHAHGGFCDVEVEGCACTASQVALLVALGQAAPAQADPDSRPGRVAERPRDAAVHAVDGEVHSIAQVGSTVVFGGNFTQVGPVTAAPSASSTPTARPSRPGSPTSSARSASRSPTAPAAGTSAARSPASAVRPAPTSRRSTPPAAVTSFDPAPNGAVYDLAADVRWRPRRRRLLHHRRRRQPPNGRRAARPRPAPSRGAAPSPAARCAPSRCPATASLVYVGGDFAQVGGVVFRSARRHSTPRPASRNTTFAAGHPEPAGQRPGRPLRAATC